MFHKILIANRGEIALRIIRACRELGIKTVSVHSTVDENSPHVRFSDESVCIGPPESHLSYLQIPRIISAAEITGADAIHPGYGFLSENARFAEICHSCKIKFIGPSSENIRTLGNKARAKEIMKAAGIPVIPGTEDQVDSAEKAKKMAREIGYPIIIKSCFGGGGRGMRIVKKGEKFEAVFSSLQKEAFNAFGESNLYIEKYIQKPKHIEFQILADTKGNIIHLGERDCSIQRRHQKLIEETPAVTLSDSLRKKMGEAAIQAAKAANYTSAGTVEFLVDPAGNFYFIEVNTRIQVEHPITEMVTGIDLIKEQIKIAAGQELLSEKKNYHFEGHSIECRINAEDPKKFIPCSGKITALNIPGGPGVRVDTAIYCDYTVLPYYDSLIAKLIVHGKNREETIRKMNHALHEFQVEGIKTTIQFHRKVFKNKHFVKGEFYTDFVDSFLQH